MDDSRKKVDMPNDEAMPSDDARTFARLVIDRFGERAVSYASYQSLKARSRGDTRGAAHWQRVAEVTQFMLRSEVEIGD